MYLPKKNWAVGLLVQPNDEQDFLGKHNVTITFHELKTLWNSDSYTNTLWSDGYIA